MMQDKYDRNLGTQKSQRNLRSGKSGPVWAQVYHHGDRGVQIRSVADPG